MLSSPLTRRPLTRSTTSHWRHSKYIWMLTVQCHLPFPHQISKHDVQCMTLMSKRSEAQSVCIEFLNVHGPLSDLPGPFRLLSDCAFNGDADWDAAISRPYRLRWPSPLWTARPKPLSCVNRIAITVNRDPWYCWAWRQSSGSVVESLSYPVSEQEFSAFGSHCWSISTETHSGCVVYWKHTLWVSRVVPIQYEASFSQSCVLIPALVQHFQGRPKCCWFSQCQSLMDYLSCKLVSVDLVPEIFEVSRTAQHASELDRSAYSCGVFLELSLSTFGATSAMTLVVTERS